MKTPNRYATMTKPTVAPKPTMPAKMAPKKATGHPHGNLGKFLHPAKKR